MQKGRSLALSSLKGVQQAVVCKAQASKLQMLATTFSGADSDIIYKAQISLFTRGMERNAAAGGVAAGAAPSLLIHLC